MQPVGQAGASALGVGTVDRHAQGTAFAHDDDLLLSACDGGVDERPGEHDVVCVLQVEDDGAVLRTLTFVDGGGIAQIQLIQHGRVVFCDPPAEVHLHPGLASILPDGGDVANVAVAHIPEVPGLHDLVPTPKKAGAIGNLGLPGPRRIQQIPQLRVEGVHAGLRLLAEGRQQRHIVHAIAFDFSEIELHHGLGGVRELGRVQKLEVRSVLQRQIAVADELGVDGDPAALPLTVDLVQPHHGDTAACDHLAQHRAGTGRGKLVCVADQNHLTARLDGVKEGACHIDVQHGDLVHQKQVCVQRRRRAEAAVVAGVEPDRPVNGGGRMPCGFLHPSGCPPGWSTADNVGFGVVLLVDVEDRLLDHGFAGARAAGDDSQGLGKRSFNGGLLFRGKPKLQTSFFGRDLPIYIYDGKSGLHCSLGNYFFRKVLFQPGRALPVDEAEVGCQSSVRQHTDGTVGQHLLRQFRGLQNLQAGGNEVVLFHTEMALALCVRQGEQQRLVHALRRAAGKSHRHGDLVRRVKGDARHLTEPVGMVLHDVQRLSAVDLEELDRPVGCDAMGCQKGDHISRCPVCQIGVPNALEPAGADPVDGQQLIRVVIKDVERLVAEGIIDPLGDLRPDALDLPGAEVREDPFLCGDQDLVVLLHFILHSVLRIALPAALELIPKIPGQRQTEAHRLDPGHGGAGRTEKLLAGAVDRHHVAGRRDCLDSLRID